MNFKKRVNGSWVDTPNYIHNTSTDTITTLPADLYSDGTNATVGLKGNMSQTGTPTPTTPIQPQECGERTGNLFDQNDFSLIQVTASAYRYGTIIGVLPQGTYVLNATKSADAQSIYLTSKLNGEYTQSTISSVPFTFPSDGESEYIIRTAKNTGTTWENEGYTNMIVSEGSLPYEPFGVKIPISSADTTTNVYLGEVETTRQITKYEFTGQEDWVLSNANNVMYVDRSGHLTGDINICYCSHYKSIVNVSSLNDIANGECCFNSTLKWFYIKDDNYTTQSAFLNYLQQQYSAGTPVTVWYVLATETTGIVNEPLRKIGTYADEVSGISIPTIAGADSFDVLTTLKPSEVSLAYTGWHDASVKEWDGSEWQ